MDKIKEKSPLCEYRRTGKKEKWADINQHPLSYKVEYHKQSLSDKKTKAHDKKMRSTTEHAKKQRRLFHTENLCFNHKRIPIPFHIRIQKTPGAIKEGYVFD